MTAKSNASPQRLAALLVNYNSGLYAERCAASLVDEWAALGRAPGDLEIVVVDNASPVDQEEVLCRIEGAGHRVVRSTENLGYAAGMNRALEETRGGPTDLVAILNPDLYFLPGSLEPLVQYITENKDCGAVDPRAFIDPDCALNLPRNLLPTLVEHTWMALAQVNLTACRAYSRFRLKKAMPWWSADGPMDADMLSGCCLFLRREVVEEMGQLMDPRYPLYYEDTDLFRTLKSMGYRLVHQGASRVLHHWSRSTGLVGFGDSEAMRRYVISQKQYYTKFYGRLGAAWIALVNGALSKCPESWHNRAMFPMDDLGDFSEPIEVQLPRSCRFLVEMGMAPNFLLSGGLHGEGDRWVCSPATWQWFFQAKYYMRVLDRDSGEVLGAWTFTKSAPGRDEPMQAVEMEAWTAPPQ
ncbi:MAG: GT2 family glycosyltransferase [Bacteroidia bacterium]